MARDYRTSIEVGHMYLDRMDNSTILHEASQAARQLAELAGSGRAEWASLIVLIDDYNRYSDPWVGWHPQDAQQAVVEAFAQKGLALDHVVLESSLAESVEQMLVFLVPEPRRGDGSLAGSHEPPLWLEEGGWLSNGDAPRPPLDYQKPARGVLIDSTTYEPPRPVLGEPRHRHRIALDVQLWSEDADARIWACPALAAWWQLVRLGALDYLEGRLGVVPDRTWSRPEARPLSAKETITFLPLQYIEIEHAAWNILRQIVLPDGWAKTLRLAGGDLPIRAHLDRISYMFTPGAASEP